MEILKTIKLIFLTLIFLGCGQQTLKDEGLETKSINEIGSTDSENKNDEVCNTDNYICNDTLLCVSSINFSEAVFSGSPEFRFTFNKPYQLGPNGSSNQTGTVCSQQIINGWGNGNTKAPIMISDDNFVNCVQYSLNHDNFSVPTTLRIQPIDSLPAGKKYKLKILKYSKDNDHNFVGLDNNSLKLEQDYCKEVTTYK